MTKQKLLSETQSDEIIDTISNYLDTSEMSASKKRDMTEGIANVFKENSWDNCDDCDDCPDCDNCERPGEPMIDESRY